MSCKLKIMDSEIKNVCEILNGLEKGSELPTSVWVTLEGCLKSACLPEQEYGEDRPCVESDFINYKEDCIPKLKALKELIRKIVQLKDEEGATSSRELIQSMDANKNFVVWTLLLCGEHASEDLWTNTSSRDLAAVCVTLLCQVYNCPSVSDLLIGNKTRSSNYFKQCLLTLRPKLLKDTWRRFPGAVASYQWLLCQVKSPHLSDHLNLVLPTALIIVDDHVMERRLIGLASLSHIVDNVARTELCCQGLQHVVYKAVQPLLLQHYAEQVEPTVTCLAKLLKKTEHGYTRTTSAGVWNRFDETLRVLLQKMECEDRLVLRSAYARSLVLLLPAMGPLVIRWGKQLLAVLDEYSHSTSFDTRREALLALQIYLQNSVPRIAFNSEKIIFILLRSLHDIINKIEEDDASSLQEQLSLVKECFGIISNVIPREDWEVIKTELCTIPSNTLFKSTIENVVIHNE